MKYISRFILLNFISHSLFSLTIGICNDGPLRIRDGKSIESNIIGKILTNEKVIIEDQDSSEVIIGGIRDHWYLIKTKTDIEGWVFGGYLTIMDSKIKASDLFLPDFLYKHDLEYYDRDNINNNELELWFMGKKFSSESFWMQSRSYGEESLGGGVSERKYEYKSLIYYFLCTRDNAGYDSIIDVKVISKPNEEAYLSSGPVYINEDYYDWDVNVLITGPFESGKNTHISKAYKANLETGKIEDLKYDSIVIFSEE